MCQLLGMNCNTPTDIVFSFEGFRRRGGLTDHHADGFGIAFFEGAGARVFLDVEPSAQSQVADFIRDYPLKSENVIAHIRKATQGGVSLANTHPFQREMWGRYWVFAHNGNLDGFAPPEGRHYRPVGCTDSERAFCFLLDTLRQRFDHEPPFVELYRLVSETVAWIRSHGTFNFILSNGKFMLAHCSTSLYYIVRQAPFTTAHLVDEDVSVDFADLTTSNDRVAVIATQPLTDNEVWIPFEANELKIFKYGAPLKTAPGISKTPPVLPSGA